MATTGKIATCLWFDTQAEEAAEFYVSLVPGSRLVRLDRYPGGEREGQVALAEIELAGQRYQLLNGGPAFPQSEAASIVVSCDGQEEVDRLWTALTADGGKDSACGWVKDRFGVSWQLIPDGLMDLMFNGDDASRRAWDALMTMQKIDFAAVRAAHAGD